MGLLSKLANGLVLVGVASMGLVAGRTNVRPLVSEALAADVRTLEVSAARERTPDAVRQLASAYLDRNEPGLATAVLEGAAPATRRDPGVAYVEARALYARGRSGEALAVLRSVQAACASDGCPAWLGAKASRQAAFLEALQEAGVEDPAAQPELAQLALERTRRQGRVVAIAMR
jgi:hypothetical protein